MQLIHPYIGIDWSKQWKGNFHTHSKNTKYGDYYYGSSDGTLTPTQVIDYYHSADYDILAITEHDVNSYVNRNTWPWTTFGRDPATLGMLAVQGKEMSYCNHICSLFNDLVRVESDDEKVVLQAIRDHGGLAVINHPGRYSETIQFYVDLFLEFRDITLGLEVHNCGDKYPNDRKTWDKINALTIPEGKIVYGYANDDMHYVEDLYKTYNFILSPTISETDVKAAMLAGQTYFCYEPGGSGEAKAPRISNIEVDESAKTVTLTIDSGTVSWITEGTATVGTGATFNYTDFDKSFFRAVTTNEFGITYTQPFVLREDKELKPRIEINGTLMGLECETKINGEWVKLKPII